MSTENDVARSLRSWLRENRHEDADRVLDVVFDQIPATPQRRAAWLARRFPTLSTYARYGLVAAAVVLAAVVGIAIYGNSVGGPPPEGSASFAPSLMPSRSPSALPTPISDPIVGTWAASATTCAQQAAAVEAAGFTTEQMTSIGMDPTCANGLVIEGSGFTIGSQFTLTFDPSGALRTSEDGVGDDPLVFRLGGGSTFEGSGPVAGVCVTWRYAIVGDQLTIELADPGCAATADAPLLDQLAQTVIFTTSAFTRQP
jgi:hypothetical protein